MGKLRKTLRDSGELSHQGDQISRKGHPRLSTVSGFKRFVKTPRAYTRTGQVEETVSEIGGKTLDQFEMSATQFGTLTRGEQTLLLARKHFENEPGMRAIFRLISKTESLDPVEPLKLLEVNENTVATGIVPIHFAPHPSLGLTYSCIIVEVTPHELEQIHTQALQLPHGWIVGESITLPDVICEQ